MSVLLTVCLWLGGCRSLSYYGQAVKGQANLWWQRRPIASVLADPQTSPSLAAKLRLAQQGRAFASRHLGLPQNRSYTYYVRLPRRYVVWNLFATPAYSVEPQLHCFPIAGCVAYQGYFSAAAAQHEAARLRQQGKDVMVGGVSAYSTLGWFADPLLSSMLTWSDDEMLGTIFHELAHQQLYVSGDTRFNESYASFVERQGLEQWHQQHGLAPLTRKQQAVDDGFSQLVLDLREQLRQLYQQPMSGAAKARAKQAAFNAFRQRYTGWAKRQGPGALAYRHWVEHDLNNASLLPFGLYEGWQPGFAYLFQQVHAQWPAFHQAVAALARKSRAVRDAQLQQWCQLAISAGLKLP